MFKSREVHVHRRAYKRSISVTLRVNGSIRVSAPKLVSRQQIEAFLLANSVWIETNLAKYQTVRAAYPQKSFVEGEMLPLLGREVRITYREGHRAKPHISVCGERLVVEIPSSRWSGFDPGVPHPEIRPIVIEFYRHAGRKLLTSRVAYFAARLELFPSALTFRSQKTRWGSCSSKGAISLNWRLVIAPQEVIDYVVVHELAHLRYYNHSRAFWGLVGKEISLYRELRDWLREHQYQADFLAKRSELHPEVE